MAKRSGGPVALASQPFFIGINDSFPASFGFNPTGAAFDPNIFSLFNAWTNSRYSLSRQHCPRSGAIQFETDYDFRRRRDKRCGRTSCRHLLGTCGTCHDTPNVGDHSVSAALNIGVADVTSPLDVSYLPVFTLVNNTTHETVQTTDPGRALITGKWADIGKVKGPILRGLASRAPYFHNGSAASLDDVLLFYEVRFKIGFTAQEKADLIAFLNSL